jgi:hypothetical protein
MNNSLPEIWNCPEAFEFICTKKWAGLTPTDIENIRHCDVCNEQVYWSANPEEFVANSKQGRCVAVPRKGMPLEGEMAGRVSPNYYHDRVEHKAEYQIWRSGWPLILDRDPFFILFLIRKGYPDALEIFIELAANFPEELELLRQAYLLLSRSAEKDKFALYLLEIGKIDEAIAISRATNNTSHARTMIWTLLKMNLVAEAQKLLPMFDYSGDRYYAPLSSIAEKMAELGQSKQAIDLYESYLSNIKKTFTDIETTILNRLPDLRLLDVFITLSTDFSAEKDLVDKACELLAEDKDRRKFALYLLNAGQLDRSIAIAKTLQHDSHLLMYMVSSFSQMYKVEEAMQIIPMLESGRSQFDGFEWIAKYLQSSNQIEKAIDAHEWYLTNIKNIPVDIELLISQRLLSLRQKISQQI